MGVGGARSPTTEGTPTNDQHQPQATPAPAAVAPAMAVRALRGTNPDPRPGGDPVTIARAKRVLYGTALSLILAGILIFVGGVAPVPGEPRSYPMRPATEAEQQQHDRDQLLDLLRAQQTANQGASR